VSDSAAMAGPGDMMRPFVTMAPELMPFMA
jgi:hypothetical protein